MTEGRWGEIERIYHEALERATPARGAFLAEACGTDPALREEVESLLSHYGGADDLLESAAWSHFEAVESYAPGVRLGPYEIVVLLGRGGMGEVYKALDTRLNREVAIKVLRDALAAGARESGRFIDEARAASALNHPHIVQIHGFESVDGLDFLVMEYLCGRTLAETLLDGLLPFDRALEYASQMVSALAAAHQARIVHRDIKPSNIVVTETGGLKLLDFGIAKRVGTAVLDRTAGAAGAASSSVMGTASYMSPEQARGRAHDVRSDVFSAGAVIYELMTGRRAFDGNSTAEILRKVMGDQPEPLRDFRPEAPKALAAIVERCLEKDPKKRFASGVELAGELAKLRRRMAPATLTRGIRAGIAALLLVMAGVAGWQYYRYSRAQWVRTRAVPEIRALMGKNEYVAAFHLLQTALRESPEDLMLREIWSEIALPIRLQTTPPGAKVAYRRYGDARAPWHELGVTPLPDVPMPAISLVALRVEKDGYEPLELGVMPLQLKQANIALYEKGKIPEGMVSVPARAPWAGSGARIPLPDFFIDRYEVRNREYQNFVDAGGYKHQTFWRTPFVRAGITIRFEEAMEAFRDGTGEAGPATWERGRYPSGRAEYPVSGISWYEAQAYCEYVGKSLPVASQWRKAGAFNIFAEIMVASNFGNAGPAPAGRYQGLSPFGAYDVAGNLREWVYNEANDGRAILGGGWGDTKMFFRQQESRDPLARDATFGGRCALTPVPLPPERTGRLRSDFPSIAGGKPANDDVYAVYRRLYEYDAKAIEERVEAVEDSGPTYRLEKVSYLAAYDGQRIPAYLYLPKNGKPPYQTVMWVPGGYASSLRSSEMALRSELFTFILESGRAVIHPVYWGHYERRDASATGPNGYRDLIFRFAKDAFRTLDYLESRADIDKERLIYFSVSNNSAPIVLALDKRVKAAVMVGSELYQGLDLPEIDPFHFAPRVQTPVLLINGRYDLSSTADGRENLYRHLGTPANKKRQRLFEAGHIPQLDDIRREVTGWLDQELGRPAKRQ